MTHFFLTEIFCAFGPFNLTSLRGKTFTGGDSTHNYFLNVCGVCNQSLCTSSSSSMLAYVPSGYYRMLKWLPNSAPAPVWTQISDGVSVAFANGDGRVSPDGPTAYPPLTTVNIHCSTNPSNLTMAVNMVVLNYIWTVDIYAPEGCVSTPTPTPAPAPAKNFTKLPTGLQLQTVDIGGVNQTFRIETLESMCEQIVSPLPCVGFVVDADGVGHFKGLVTNKTQEVSFTVRAMSEYLRTQKNMHNHPVR